MSSGLLAQKQRQSLAHVVIHLGVGKNMLSKMENGDDDIEVKHWVTVAENLQVPVSDIFQGERWRLQAYLKGQEGVRRRAVDRAQFLESLARARDAASATNRSAVHEDVADWRDEIQSWIPIGDALYPPGMVTLLDLDTRRQLVRSLSGLGLTLYELEALIFVAAVTHFRRAAMTYKLHPEDFAGRLAALHRAVDDASYYGRAFEFVYDSANISELGNDVQPDKAEWARYEQAINRWGHVHGEILQAWTADESGHGSLGPEWDADFRPDKLLEELRGYLTGVWLDPNPGGNN